MRSTRARAANDFANFETGQVRPLAVQGDVLLAVNTPDARLSVFRASALGGLELMTEVPVGLEPVAVAFHGSSEAWVVDHPSDSISIVSLTADLRRSHVSRTLYTCDEPRDIVFAGPDRHTAFVTAALQNREKAHSKWAKFGEQVTGPPRIPRTAVANGRTPFCPPLPSQRALAHGNENVSGHCDLVCDRATTHAARRSAISPSVAPRKRSSAAL